MGYEELEKEEGPFLRTRSAVPVDFHTFSEDQQAALVESGFSEKLAKRFRKANAEKPRRVSGRHEVLG